MHKNLAVQKKSMSKLFILAVQKKNWYAPSVEHVKGVAVQRVAAGAEGAAPPQGAGREHGGSAAGAPPQGGGRGGRRWSWARGGRWWPWARARLQRGEGRWWAARKRRGERGGRCGEGRWTTERGSARRRRGSGRRRRAEREEVDGGADAKTACACALYRREEVGGGGYHLWQLCQITAGEQVLLFASANMRPGPTS